MSFMLNPKLTEDTWFILDLTLSKLFLMKDANFKWFILVPRVEGVKEIIDLNEKDRNLLFKEICDLSEVVKQNYHPDKLNIANIGNVVEQLHIHIILRTKDDPLYPKPVWGHSLPKKEYSKAEVEVIIALMKRHFVEKN